MKARRRLLAVIAVPVAVRVAVRTALAAWPGVHGWPAFAAGLRRHPLLLWPRAWRLRRSRRKMSLPDDRISS
jgi:hypothetical protein